jgi:hypothetical protein
VGNGLKKVLGLGEPSKKEAAKLRTEQGKTFNKAFRATLKQVNGHLEYTAIRAEEARHDELSQKRELSYAAYHAAVKKIDPANPAVANDSLEQVTAAIEGLEASARTLREQAERHYSAWADKEPQFDAAAEQVVEMVGWGHAKGSGLQQVVTAINEQAKLRKYKEALEAFNQFLEKLGPIFAEFATQADAKIGYDGMLAEKQLKVEDFQAVSFVTLGEWQAEIQENLDGIQQTADGLDYVTAFAELEPELLAVEDFLGDAAELQKSKEEYETARTELQTRLDKGAGWEIMHVQENIDRLKAAMEKSATDEDFVGALATLRQLSPEVDLKLKLIDKSIYESVARSHEATFTSAAGIVTAMAGTPEDDFYPLKMAKESYTAGKKDLDDLVAAEKWSEASAKLPATAATAQFLIDQRAGYDRCNQEFALMIPDINYMSELNKNAPRNKEWNAELQVYDAFGIHFNGGEFDKALADMRKLKPMMADLRTRVAASDAVASPKADAAVDKVRALAGGRNASVLSNDEREALTEELRKLSHKEQRQLLEHLHAPSTKLTAEQRVMQVAIYKAMSLDEEFEQTDLKIRDQYQAEMASDAELMNAIKDWQTPDASGAPLVDEETKKKMLKRILATQSKAYGIDVPVIEWTKPTETFAGKFMPNTGRLLVNPRFLNDPNSIIETVIHENTHKFQDDLVKKYMDGKLSKHDPMYEQAKTLAVTYGDDAYVFITEDEFGYKYQPKEKQAIDAGLLGAVALTP